MIFQNPVLNTATNVILTGLVFLLGVLVLFCIIRSILGPRIADRVLSINMIGTMTITAIAVIAVLRSQLSLVDISLLYALISFLAVVVLSRIYRGDYLERKERRAQAKASKEKGDE